jgi:hypothetical protein
MITAFAFLHAVSGQLHRHHALHGDVRYPGHAPCAWSTCRSSPATSAGSWWRCRWCWSRSSFRSPAAFPQHRKVARWTFPIWLYVSVTGVIVYAMLAAAGIEPSPSPRCPPASNPTTAPANCCNGARRYSARACWPPCCLTLLGGFSPTGASTNTGWFALIVALMCIPFGGLLLALGVAKWLRNRIFDE